MASARHPAGLYVLFFSEMWERFSYYGMRALLQLYMINYLLWTQEDASSIYKWYTSLVYLTPILGGYFADRWLGNKNAVILGGLLMAAGQFSLASDTQTGFFAGLVLLIVGNGFFKPNMSTQVGRLYTRDDPRRDSAYTIFYMGINLGACAAPIVCGWLRAHYGYSKGFLAAGFGMLLGLAIYIIFQRWVVEVDRADGRGETAKVGEQGGEPDGERPGAHGGASSAASDGKPAVASEGTVSRADHPLRGTRSVDEAVPAQRAALTEREAEAVASASPTVNRLAPGLFRAAGWLMGLGLTVVLLLKLAASFGPFAVPPEAAASGGVLAWAKGFDVDQGAILAILGLCAILSAWILDRVQNGVRDRVLSIYLLGIFAVCFWGGFEQAGNVMNLWADKNTDRFLSRDPEIPSIFPAVDRERWSQAMAEVATGEGSGGGEPQGVAADGGKSLLQSLEDNTNPVPTEWFQSVNALAIFVLAPLFSALWIWLDRRRLNPSSPAKMALGCLFMTLGFAIMVAAAARENRRTETALEALPSGIALDGEGKLCLDDPERGLVPFHAGRLRFDSGARRLEVLGVLPDVERDRVLRATAAPAFARKVEELQALTEQTSGGTVDVRVTLESVPPALELRYSGIPATVLDLDPATRTLRTRARLTDRDVKAILVGASDPTFRHAMDDLFIKSSAHAVSPWWLFWFYILSTLGELCLSPVGLSMVSKLAPARYATMLMGLWFLTTFLGNFVAGAFGEAWNTVAPGAYFWIFVGFLGLATLVLFVFRKRIAAMMHGVN